MAQKVDGTAAGDLFTRVLEAPAAQHLARRLEQGGALSLGGVAPGAHAFFAATLCRLFPRRPIVVVTEGLKAQELTHQDVTTWLSLGSSRGNEAPSSRLPEAKSKSEPASANPTKPPLFHPAWETLPQDDRLPHPDIISERLETLIALMAAKAESAPLVVTTVTALMQRTFPRQTLNTSARRVARGDRINPLDLVEWLEDQGYEPEAQVTHKGELALRGGILDVFPLTSPWPVRLEFFGDELESLREFDPVSQVSRTTINEVTLSPAGELGVLKKAKAGEGTLGTLLDYLPKETLFLLCEAEQLGVKAEEYGAQIAAGDKNHIGWDEFQEQARARGMTLMNVTELDAPGSEGLPRFQSLDAFRPLGKHAAELPVAEAQRREFFAQLHRWLRQDWAVHVFCNNTGERDRFAEIWDEYGLTEKPAVEEQPAPKGRGAKKPKPTPTGPTPELHLGALARGFLNEDARLVVVTDAEIFGRYRVQRPRRLKSPHAAASRSALDIDFTDLEDGDYVVHLQHGIGRYLGLQMAPAGLGRKNVETLPDENGAGPQTSGQECLVIEFAANDPAQPPPKLYVPVTEAHLVAKYVGTGKVRPPLNTLGGTRWAKAKAHAEAAVRDVASDLLAIQAARESQAGHSFAPDTPWQREFESAFVYEETPDQLRAINDAKADMERPKPMDRLICGDVGFGKTEVGIRAAFKAVMDGRQVAILVPTTVLAQQHYNTFRERMADYPIRIELLSRFRTRREQAKVIEDLAAGAVDIVIGTHRLLQKDIVFKDLGLVVIDEEQRFGVMHKEKFKLLRHLVDVLTLSATPIPRTLYLALTGARDMSTIQTPPHDRLPVETIVTGYDERIIRDAIQRELGRGGQVFFLHNRVMTIQNMAGKLQQLVPNARIIVGHGQMNSDDLEEVMTQFVNGEADVLLSTTIIESGLDIPNANTIIIDRADRFGLSDLYQLRGRVGRYKHQAYAYLLLPRHGGLVSDVRKRLSAIKQYSTLGSGFKIAMRDLEIRGAGNLLGAEQSGHITAVGFELYCQLLKQSVAALKGEKVKRRVEVQVRLDFLNLNPVAERKSALPVETESEDELPEPNADLGSMTGDTSLACIPLSYISDDRQRITIYRKLAQITERSALDELVKELRDRFGPVPPAVALLLRVSDLKLTAAERGITSVEVKEDKLILMRGEDYVMQGTRFPRLTQTDASARLGEIAKLVGSA